jgi:hypothetical protein
MTFLEFVRSYEGSWILDDGFLRMALADPRFPDIQDWPELAAYLVVHNANAKAREDARRFWDQYRGLKHGSA